MYSDVVDRWCFKHYDTNTPCDAKTGSEYGDKNDLNFVTQNHTQNVIVQRVSYNIVVLLMVGVVG